MPKPGAEGWNSKAGSQAANYNFDESCEAMEPWLEPSVTCSEVNAHSGKKVLTE